MHVPAFRESYARPVIGGAALPLGLFSYVAWGGDVGWMGQTDVFHAGAVVERSVIMEIYNGIRGHGQPEEKLRALWVDLLRVSLGFREEEMRVYVGAAEEVRFTTSPFFSTPRHMYSDYCVFVKLESNVLMPVLHVEVKPGTVASAVEHQDTSKLATELAAAVCEMYAVALASVRPVGGNNPSDAPTVEEASQMTTRFGDHLCAYGLLASEGSAVVWCVKAAFAPSGGAPVLYFSKSNFHIKLVELNSDDRSKEAWRSLCVAVLELARFWRVAVQAEVRRSGERITRNSVMIDLGAPESTLKDGYLTPVKDRDGAAAKAGIPQSSGRVLARSAVAAVAAAMGLDLGDDWREHSRGRVVVAPLADDAARVLVVKPATRAHAGGVLAALPGGVASLAVPARHAVVGGWAGLVLDRLERLAVDIYFDCIFEGEHDPSDDAATEARFLAFACDMLDALAALHGAGIVHRDVKVRLSVRFWC